MTDIELQNEASPVKRATPSLQTGASLQLPRLVVLIFPHPLTGHTRRFLSETAATVRTIIMISQLYLLQSSIIQYSSSNYFSIIRRPLRMSAHIKPCRCCQNPTLASDRWPTKKARLNESQRLGTFQSLLLFFAAVVTAIHSATVSFFSMGFSNSGYLTRVFPLHSKLFIFFLTFFLVCYLL